MKEFFAKIIAKLKAIDKGTLCRTILQICAYINQIVAVFGSASFASSLPYQIISLVVTIVITGVTYWFNNDWSKLAILLRDIWDMVKDGKITPEEIEDFMKKHKDNPPAEK